MIEPITDIVLIGYLGTETQVAINSFKKVEFLCNIDTTVGNILHMQHRLQNILFVYPFAITIRRLHVYRNERSALGGYGIQVIVIRTSCHQHDLQKCDGIKKNIFHLHHNLYTLQLSLQATSQIGHRHSHQSGSLGTKSAGAQCH